MARPVVRVLWPQADALGYTLLRLLERGYDTFKLSKTAEGQVVVKAWRRLRSS